MPMAYFTNNKGRGRGGRTLPNLSISHTSDQENGPGGGQSQHVVDLKPLAEL